MDYLEKKSHDNYNAIDLLNSNNFYAPAIHCAYYSSLQLIIKYFYDYCGITEEQAQRDINEGGNSHNYYLTNVVNELKKIDKENASKFYYYFTKFKRKRVEADYYNIDISKTEGEEAKECASKIRKFLNLINDEGECKNIYYI